MSAVSAPVVDGIELPERAPECPLGHGPMVLRDPPRGWTPEQRWCGVWYDCAPGPVGVSCRSSVLIASPELVAAQGRRGVACGSRVCPTPVATRPGEP